MLFGIPHNFNSQPHEEADLMLYSPFLRCSISTHSLTKRLTDLPVSANLLHNHFNSQPHEEADGLAAILWRIVGVNFNSQPHEEADGVLLSPPVS